jgi:hypothetical protein
VINASGTFLQYIYSTNPTDLVNVRFGDSANDGAYSPWQPGNGKLGFPFDKLTILVPTAIASATATFEFAQVDPDEAEAIRFI